MRVFFFAAVAPVLAGCGAPEMAAPLPPAPATKTLQVSTPAFTLQPGQEVFKCYFTSLPSESEVAVTRLRSSMTPGSHHMILFYQLQQAVPDGTLADCDEVERGLSPQNLPFPLFLSQEPEDKLDFPDGVAVPLRGRQPLMFQMHYLNAGAAPIAAKVDLTFEYTTGDYRERAGPFASFFTRINVPPKGTQTVEGHCKVPSGSRFFSMTTHSHRFSTSASVHRWRDGVKGAQLVETRDWEHPTVARWANPFLVLSDDEEVHYSCTYKNDGERAVKTGDSAATNEMCMAVGYYFPASRATVCVDSRSYTF